MRKLRIKSCWLEAGGAEGLVRRLRDLPRLSSVEVTGGHTDLILSALADHCPELQSVKASQCSDLTDGGLLALCGTSLPSPGYEAGK